jgi:hypothetical protein
VTRDRPPIPSSLTHTDTTHPHAACSSALLDTNGNNPKQGDGDGGDGEMREACCTSLTRTVSPIPLPLPLTPAARAAEVGTEVVHQDLDRAANSSPSSTLTSDKSTSSQIGSLRHHLVTRHAISEDCFEKHTTAITRPASSSSSSYQYHHHSAAAKGGSDCRPEVSFHHTTAAPATHTHDSLHTHHNQKSQHYVTHISNTDDLELDLASIREEIYSHTQKYWSKRFYNFLRFTSELEFAVDGKEEAYNFKAFRHLM